MAEIAGLIATVLRSTATTARCWPRCAAEVARALRRVRALPAEPTVGSADGAAMLTSLAYGGVGLRHRHRRAARCVRRCAACGPTPVAPRPPTAASTPTHARARGQRHVLRRARGDRRGIACRPASTRCSPIPRNIVGVVAAAVVMWLTGLVDDIRDVSAPAKMAGIVLSGSMLHPRRRHDHLLPRAVRRASPCCRPTWRPLITVLWVVGMANAVNLIDGLDGLAAGIVGHRRGGVLPLRVAAARRGRARPLQRRAAGRRRHRRRLPGVPALQLQPGQHLHGRQRGADARGC